MIPELILTALFLGWLLRGKFGRLADVRIKYAWMIFVPLGLYVAALAANYSHVFPKSSWVFGLVHAVALAALLTLTVANRNIPGVKLMFAGLAANAVAIAANGGYMPTSAKAAAAIWGKEVLEKTMAQSLVRHAFMDATTNLRLLCDIIAARRPFVYFQSVYSIGDVLLSLGCFIAIIAIMRTPLASERRVAKEA